MTSTRRPHRARTLALLLAFAALALAVPAAASAGVTCSLSGTTLDVQVTSGTTAVAVERGTGAAANDIVITDVTQNAPASCGGSPTVNNVDTVAMHEAAAGQSTVFKLMLANGPFGPGATDEAGSSDEIEFTIDADNSGTDLFYILGAGTPDNLRFGALAGGSTGVNLNGAEPGTADSDVTLSGIDRVSAETGAGADTLTGDGSGAPEFTGPMAITTGVDAGTGDDTIKAGSADNNDLDGGADNDTLVGGSGNDFMRLGTGNDVADGGAGNDWASYINSAGPVHLDLGKTGPQDTGGEGIDTLSGFENGQGSNGDDTIIGTDGPNQINGGQGTNDHGDDTLIGRGGDDELEGWKGDDTLVGGQGNDTMTGNAGNDTVSYATGSTGPVTVSLAAPVGTPQDTGGAGSDTLIDDTTVGGPPEHGVENIVGSQFADHLTGDDRVNAITGGAGADALTLGDNDDTFDSYDGSGDTVDCGNGNDSGVADEQGVDSLTACETTDFAPQTSIANGPASGSATNDSTPTYAMSADEPSSFQVRIDGGSFTGCASASCTPTALADGAHTLTFRAVDSDEAHHADLIPATRTITVDTHGPAVKLDAGPPATTLNARPAFAFSSEAAAHFQCRFDGKAFAPCADPTGPTGTHAPAKALAPGAHTFAVRAIDGVGNVGTAASSSFTVVPAKIAARTNAKVSRNRRARIATITCGAAPCTIATSTARLRLAGKATRIKVATRTPAHFAAGAKGSVKVVLTRRQYRQLRRAKGGALTLKLSAHAAGATVTRSAKTTLAA